MPNKIYYDKNKDKCKKAQKLYRDKNKQSIKERRKIKEKEWDILGLCHRCGKYPKKNNCNTCENCLLKRNKYEQKLKNSNRGIKCGRCGKLTSDLHCKECKEIIKEKMKRRRSKNKSNGLCSCGAIAKENNYYGGRKCLKCKFKKLENQYGLEQGSLLKIFREQNELCPYTGEKLDESNLELDHKMPKNQGGSNDISNLHFVLTSVNKMKHQLNEQEFFDLIEKVHHKHINKL